VDDHGERELDAQRVISRHQEMVREKEMVKDMIRSKAESPALKKRLSFHDFTVQGGTGAEVASAS